MLADKREDAGDHPERRDAAPPLHRPPCLLLPQQESQEVRIIPMANYYLTSFMHFLRKVRSRLYSRLYSERDYHHVIRKSDLKAVVENKLKEILPFSEEFERYIRTYIHTYHTTLKICLIDEIKYIRRRLEKLSWDTIERKTSFAESQSNRRRNRYITII